MQQLPLGVRWRDSSVFATFLPGANTLALAQLQTLDRGSPVALWLWGARGSGKSHLLQASCARAGALDRSAAYFTLRDRFGPDALAGCEHLDLVCLDDVETVAGNAEWERAIFNLYNGLQEQQGRLLLSSEGSPKTIPWSLPDLRSRMLASIAYELKPLTEDEQREVLQLRARTRGLELPAETANFLLRHYPRDLRTLCNLLDTLDAASLAAQRRLTIPFIKEVIDQRP